MFFISSRIRDQHSAAMDVVLCDVCANSVWSVETQPCNGFIEQAGTLRIISPQNRGIQVRKVSYIELSWY